MGLSLLSHPSPWNLESTLGYLQYPLCNLLLLRKWGSKKSACVQYSCPLLRHLCSAFQSTDTKSVLAWKGQLCIFKHLQKYMPDIYSDEKEKVGLETLVFFVVLCVCAWEESIHQLSHTAKTRFRKISQAVPCSHVIVVLERLRETQTGSHWILPVTRSQTIRLRTPSWSSKARFPASPHV